MMDRQQAKKWITETGHPGWLNLVDIIYDNVPGHVQIDQVFQKWAGLDVDYTGEDENFQYLLDALNRVSKCMCEECGMSGRLSIIDGWETTLCDHHHAASDAKEKYRSDKH